MIKIIVFLLKVALGAASVFWFMKHPGTVEIRWPPYFIETSVAVGSLLIFALLILCIILTRGWVYVSYLSQQFMKVKRLQKVPYAYLILSRAYAAWASGDYEDTQALIKKSRDILGNVPLILYLEALTAQVLGEKKLSHHLWQQLASNPEVSALGAVPLIEEAKKEGSLSKALEVAEKASLLVPQAPWALERLAALQLETGRVEEAEKTVQQLEKAIGRTPAHIYRQKLWLLQRTQALAVGDNDKAHKLSQKAYDLDHTLTEAIQAYARDLCNQDKKAKAIKVLEKAWGQEPSIPLAETLQEITLGVDLPQRLKWYHQVSQAAYGHPLNKLLILTP